MTDEPLLRKLQVKRGRSLRLIAAPDDYVERITPLPGDSAFVAEGYADVVQVFVRKREEIAARAQALSEAASGGGILWVSYPKATGKAPTDIDPEADWAPLGQFGWRPVSHISIDEKWDAVRFRQEENAPPRAR